MVMFDWVRVFVCNDYVKRSESSHRLEYRAVYISVIILIIIIYLDKPDLSPNWREAGAFSHKGHDKFDRTLLSWPISTIHDSCCPKLSWFSRRQLSFTYSYSATRLIFFDDADQNRVGWLGPPLSLASDEPAFPFSSTENVVTSAATASPASTFLPRRFFASRIFSVWALCPFDCFPCFAVETVSCFILPMPKSLFFSLRHKHRCIRQQVVSPITANRPTIYSGETSRSMYPQSNVIESVCTAELGCIKLLEEACGPNERIELYLGVGVGLALVSVSINYVWSFSRNPKLVDSPVLVKRPAGESTINLPNRVVW